MPPAKRSQPQATKASAPQSAQPASRRSAFGCCIPFLSIFIVLFSLLLASPRLSSIQPLPVLSFVPLSSFSGKTIVITGGTSGVGLEAARTLSRSGASLFVTARTEARAKAAADSLETPGATGLELDLTNPSSIDKFTETIKRRVKKLDVLILNAGMVYGPDFVGPYTALFPGGRVDAMIAANHLGHFQLVQNLLDLILESNTRVVVVSSISHYWGTVPSVSQQTMLVNPTEGVDGETLTLASSVAAFPFLYGATKLLNVLMAERFDDLYGGGGVVGEEEGGKSVPRPSVVVCSPGFAATSIGQSTDRSGSSPLANFPLARSASQGGDMLVYAASLKDARAAKGKMLQPYWILEGVEKVLGTGRARAALYNFVQELMLQKLSAGNTAYAHRVSEEGRDKELQIKTWEWSLGMVGKKKEL